MKNNKSKRRFTQPRSFEMNLVAYYLARCSLASKPPIVLGFDNWNSAYEYFRRAVGDGREIKTFRNSIDPVRRSFDKLLSDDKQYGDEICEKDQSFHNKWKVLSNEELEKRVLRLVSGES